MAVLTEWHGDVAVVRLSRPPVNALSRDMVSELLDTLTSLAATTPQPVVLTGDASAFCAGLDVKDLAASTDEQRAELVRRINAMITQLYGFPAPTVAAVNGHALGAGMVLTLACDARLCVADDAVKIGLTEVTAGVSYPAGPMEVVIAELEPSLRRRLVFSGDVISPARAHAAGIIDGLAAADALLNSAVELARARRKAGAYAEIKAQLRGATLRRMRDIVSGG